MCVYIHRLTCSENVFQEEVTSRLRASSTSHSYRIFRKPCLLMSARWESPSWSIVGVISRPMMHSDLLLALAPDFPVPTQLRQANAALTHLLQKGISPSNIVIGGDSAGGNLTLQLASHLLHPLASIPAPPTLSQPLAGALLISPWVAYSVDAPSYVRNDGKDLILSRAYKFMGDVVRLGVTPELEHHVEPATAPAGWWSGLDGVYPRILITTGEHECLFDQIIDASSIIGQHVKDTTTVVEPGGVHEDMITKFVVGQGGNGKDYDATVAFLTRSFGGRI